MSENIYIPQMLTIDKTAELFGLSKHFIRSLALSNKIVNVRAGKKILINCQKLSEYLNTGGNFQQEQEHSTTGITPVRL